MCLALFSQHEHLFMTKYYPMSNDTEQSVKCNKTVHMVGQI